MDDSLSTISILLVEDEPLWQAGVQSLIGLESHLKLVGIDDNYDDALANYQTKKPQIVLIDWKLIGEKDGLDLGKSLVELGHNPQRIILVSGSDPALFPEQPIPYPFVPKPKIASLLIQTIQKSAVSPSLKSRL